MIPDNYVRLSRDHNLEMLQQRCSFLQDHRKRKDKLSPIKQGHEGVAPKFDNPFVFKGKRKMIVNLNKIIHKSMSDKKNNSQPRNKFPFQKFKVDSITQEYDPMQETACFNFFNNGTSQLPNILKYNKNDIGKQRI